MNSDEMQKKLYALVKLKSIHIENHTKTYHRKFDAMKDSSLDWEERCNANTWLENNINLMKNPSFVSLLKEIESLARRLKVDDNDLTIVPDFKKMEDDVIMWIKSDLLCHGIIV